MHAASRALRIYHTAIDVDKLACDVAGVVAEQEMDHAGHLIWSSDPL
jgi:hypothetical protein